jgi:hypothetical protein
MRLAAVPQNLAESLALAAGIVPTPLLDTFVALLLAKTIIAAVSLGIFHALESEPLTIEQIAKRCNTAPRPTAKLVLALVACKYLRRRGRCFFMAPVARRWLSPASPHSLHWAVLHRQLDLRFMDFEEYVRHDKFRDFHSALTSDTAARLITRARLSMRSPQERLSRAAQPTCSTLAAAMASMRSRSAGAIPACMAGSLTSESRMDGNTSLCLLMTLANAFASRGRISAAHRFRPRPPTSSCSPTSFITSLRR